MAAVIRDVVDRMATQLQTLAWITTSNTYKYKLPLDPPFPSVSILPLRYVNDWNRINQGNAIATAYEIDLVLVWDVEPSDSVLEDRLDKTEAAEFKLLGDLDLGGVVTDLFESPQIPEINTPETLETLQRSQNPDLPAETVSFLFTFMTYTVTVKRLIV